jgi:hypothetical protein
MDDTKIRHESGAVFVQFLEYVGLAGEVHRLILNHDCAKRDFSEE